MRGLMMDFPLTVPALLERAGNIFGKVEIVTSRPDRARVRYTWQDLYRRARRLANALTGLGLQRGDRVASLLWNQSEHMESYFGVPIAGGVLHTLNMRLHPDEISFIANHAGDRFLIVGDVLHLRHHGALEGRCLLASRGHLAFGELLRGRFLRHIVTRYGFPNGL